jgi:hypothetical protein
MEERKPTHAEAVFIARALNLKIETVWGILQHVPFTSYADMETAVTNNIDSDSASGIEEDYKVPSV